MMAIGKRRKLFLKLPFSGIFREKLPFLLNIFLILSNFYGGLGIPRRPLIAINFDRCDQLYKPTPLIVCKGEIGLAQARAGPRFLGLTPPRAGLFGLGPRA